MITPSINLKALETLPEKSTCPGVSIRFSKYFCLFPILTGIEITDDGKEIIQRFTDIEPDIDDITYSVVVYDKENNECIIEINKEDYEKVKDKIIEILEE